MSSYMQDLEKKEGGSNGQAEEITDGTATKAGSTLHVAHSLPQIVQCAKAAQAP